MTDSKDGERIAKVLSRAGIASRRDAERMIELGRIGVNGRTIDSPALNVGPKDRITVDGQPLAPPEPARLWLYYKPEGLVTSASDEKGRETVFDHLPEGLPRVMSVGRLDLNSEGLLLLTNDGELKRRLELPSTGWLRKYRVRVKGNPTDPDLEPLRKGITVEGESFQPMTVSLDRVQGANAWLTVGLREGKNREIRRAMSAIGLTVNRLIRVSYGPFRLNELEPGMVEEVRPKILRDQLGLDPQADGEARPARGRKPDGAARPARSEGTARPARSEGTARPARSEGSARSARSEGTARPASSEGSTRSESAARPPRGAAADGPARPARGTMSDGAAGPTKGRSPHGAAPKDGARSAGTRPAEGTRPARSAGADSARASRAGGAEATGRTRPTEGRGKPAAAGRSGKAEAAEAPRALRGRSAEAPAKAPRGAAKTAGPARSRREALPDTPIDARAPRGRAAAGPKAKGGSPAKAAPSPRAKGPGETAGGRPPRTGAPSTREGRKPQPTGPRPPSRGPKGRPGGR
ncbi:pseudouridine synthase [Cereibacter johrii]|uniref:Pseudouridine synthase n=1 Tax=Cereibacter johrii TaxID=445629 RepID=A0ABX5JCU8_9RHOB|nr:pseudouridine synthase [Cereibacter johrii]PTM81646.1 pseudouridine synthase [Cereibacter johrii]